VATNSWSTSQQQLQSLLSDGKATTAHCNWAFEHVSTGEKVDQEAMALVKSNRRREKQGKDKMRRLQQILTEEGKGPRTQHTTAGH